MAARRSPEHLITTAARKTRCPLCRGPVYAGLAEGLPVAADPTPIDPASEAGLHRAGVRTFALARSNGELELWERTFWRTGPSRYLLIAEHPHSEARLGATDPGEKATARRRSGRKQAA